MKNIFKGVFSVLLFSSLLYAQHPKEVQKNELEEIKALALLNKAKIEVKTAFDMGLNPLR